MKDAILLGCIGSLQTAVFHVVACTDEHPVDKFVTLADKPIELSSVQGVVLNGQPHFHIVMSDLQQTYTGHLEEGCVVLYLAEITLLEVKNLNLYRKKNEAGIGLITAIE
ncbi:PCC domain-containing protein [Sporomusa carbonis]|uniref:PCC domain-containing protein n=1 Tax=Sporomusa carbonis TaxID=3076075 RepID=UPI003C7CC3BF